MEILQLKDFLLNGSIENKNIIVGKTKKTILLGPIINNEFDSISFYKRIISSSLFDLKNYKKLSIKKARIVILKYVEQLSNNEICEIDKKGQITKHSIIGVPTNYNEE